MPSERCRVDSPQLIAAVGFAEEKRAELMRRLLFPWLRGNPRAAPEHFAKSGRKPLVRWIAVTGIASRAKALTAQSRSTGRAVAILALLALQLLGLWGLNLAGIWVVERLHLPLPGNLVGMVGLYLLLSFGLVKLSWFDRTGSFLIKHLAFFFVPITVGLMDAGGLFAAHGFEIAITLIVSAAAGILLSGFVAQCLARRTEHEEKQ